MKEGGLPPYMMHSKQERMEAMRNRMIKEMLVVMKAITENFFAEEFTQDDLEEALSGRYGSKVVKRGLNKLVKKGILDNSSKNNFYKINHSSTKLSMILDLVDRKDYEEGSNDEDGLEVNAIKGKRKINTKIQRIEKDDGFWTIEDVTD